MSKTGRYNPRRAEKGRNRPDRPQQGDTKHGNRKQSSMGRKTCLCCGSRNEKSCIFTSRRSVRFGVVEWSNNIGAGHTAPHSKLRTT